MNDRGSWRGKISRMHSGRCWSRCWHRAVATRYDKLSVRFEATVLAAAVNEWL